MPSPFRLRVWEGQTPRRNYGAWGTRGTQRKSRWKSKKLFSLGVRARERAWLRGGGFETRPYGTWFF